MRRLARVVWIVFIGAWCSPGGAQDGLFGLSPGPSAAPFTPAKAPPVAAPAPAPGGFRIGRDNFAFANPSGAVTIRGMGGNCYTMAVAAKYLYEAARYDPAGTPGFSRRAIAANLRAPSGQAEPITITGATDLYDLSTPPEGVDSEDWMRGWSRHFTGLDPAPPESPQPPNTRAAAALYELITTIHYLHYMQFQAGVLLRSALAKAEAGAAAAPRVTLRALAKARAELAAGRLPVLCLFHPDPAIFYGHAVLVYGAIPREDGAVDLLIYDSNAQYKGSRATPESDRDESIVRVHEDGRFELKFRLARDGSVVDNPMYGRSAWFKDEANRVLLVFDDLESDPALRAGLAEKLALSDEAAAYTMAGGDLLRRVTTVPPGESSFFEDVRDFVLATQRVNDALGVRPGWRDHDLRPGATPAELNRHLARYSAAAVAQLYPQALPDGVRLEDPRLAFDPTDPNAATLEITLALARSRSVDAILDGLAESALLHRDGQLAALIRGGSAAFEGDELTVRARLRLEKGPAPPALKAKLGDFMPVPRLLASHTRVGRLSGDRPALTDRRHRFEVSEAVAARFARSLLDDAGLLGLTLRAGYPLPVIGNRSGRVTLEDLRPRTIGDGGRGAFGVVADYSGWLAVSSPRRGVAVEDGRVGLYWRLRPTRRANVLEVSGAVSGTHTIEMGLVDWLERLLSAAVSGFFTKVGRRFESSLDGFIEERLEPYLGLVGPGPGLRGLTVTGGALSWQITPFEVDIERSLEKLLGLDAEEIRRRGLEVVDLGFTDDRAVLEIAEGR